MEFSMLSDSFSGVRKERSSRLLLSVSLPSSLFCATSVAGFGGGGGGLARVGLMA